MERANVLISGASGGLGSGVREKFLSEGFRVAAFDSHRSAGNIQAGGQLFSYPTDLGDEREVGENFQKACGDLGNINAAVLTVGGFSMGSLAETGLGDLERMFRINFNTAYTLTRELIPQMQTSGGGQVIYIGSGPAIHPELAGSMIAYALSKTLLLDLSEIINLNYKDAGISSTVIIPGIIDTPKNREAMPDADYSKWQTPGKIAGRIFELFTPEGESGRGGIIEI